MYHQGTVQDGLALSQQQQKPIVVILLDPKAEASAALERVLLDVQEMQTPLVHCVFLSLNDDLQNDNPAMFKDAKMFRQLCPAISELPALLAFAPVGRGSGVLLQREGELASSSSILDDLARVLAPYLAAQPTRPLLERREEPGEEEENDDDDVPELKDAEILKTAEPIPILIKLSDGDKIFHVCPPGATVGDVFDAVDAARADSTVRPPPYVLVSSFPQRQVFGPEQALRPLTALGVQPRTVLSVVAHPNGHNAPSKPHASNKREESNERVSDGRNIDEMNAGEEPTVKYEVLPPQSKKRPLEEQGSPASLPPATPEQPNSLRNEENGPVFEVKPYKIQVKLPNGLVLRHEFDPETSLGEVRLFIDSNRNDTDAASSSTYVLATPFPRKRFDEPGELSQTLRDLGLGPSATLVLERTGPSSNRTDSDEPGGIFGTLRSAVGWLNRWTHQGWAVPTGNPGDGKSRNSTRKYEMGIQPDVELVEEHDATESGTKARKSVERMRRGSARVRTLDDVQEREERGGKHNSYWNGNSTQFDGDEDEDDRKKQ